MKPRIAIIGGCFSRDLFNSEFIPSWRENFECIYYAFQTSMLSLASPPVPYSRFLLSYEGKGHTKRAQDFLVRELNKSFMNDLLSLRPDVLMLDFYADSLHGVIEVEDGVFVTRQSKDIPGNAVYAQLDKIKKRYLISLDSYEEYMHLWKEAALLFIDFLAEYLPDMKVILNCPVFGDTILYPSGRRDEYETEYVARVNSIHRSMISWFDENCKNSAVLKLEGRYYIDPNYIYGGAWIAHFHKNYYEDAYAALIRLCAELSASKNEGEAADLLANGSFKYGTIFMKYADSAYKIKSAGEEHMACIDVSGLEKPVWNQAWFCDVPIDGSGSVSYTLSFDVCVSSKTPLYNNTVFLVRTFDKEGLYAKRDSVQELGFSWNGRDKDRFVHCSFTFKPKGNFISCGMFCALNGCIAWKNIHLYRNETEPEKPLENVTEKLLVRGRRLTDMNNIPLYY